MASEDPGVKPGYGGGRDSMDQVVSGDHEAGLSSRSLSE